MIVYTASTIQKNKFIISAKLGSGGEGTVYGVEGNPDICVKIYHEQKRTPELEAKLKAMIDAPPKDPTLAAGHYSICWPTNVVYEDEACTKFLGFIMPRIDKNTFKEYHLLCDKPSIHTSVCYRLENFGTNFTYLNMYAAALNLVRCVFSIHTTGHAIGDLNDKNILVSTQDSKITIVDCDSFEIHSEKIVFPCIVFTPEYSAPEVIKKEKIEHRQASDCFALAILLFKLLMLNTHPFASRGLSVEHLSSPEEKIVYGKFPYEQAKNNDIQPPNYAMSLSLLPPQIKKLFMQCFVDGQHCPTKRPKASEWSIVLKDEYLKMVSKLSNNKSMCRQNNRHVYPTHLKQCPWCGLDEDYFPEKIRNLKLEKMQLLKDVQYIQMLLNDYLGDGMLTKDEQEKLYSVAKEKNFTLESIDKLIKNIKLKNPSILLGEPPEISEQTFNLGIIEKTDMGRELIFRIKNKFLYHSLTIHITNLPTYMTLLSGPAVIKEQNEAEYRIAFDAEIMHEAEKGLFTKHIKIHLSNEMINTELDLMVNGTIREYFYEKSDWITITNEDYYKELRSMALAMARDNMISQEEFNILKHLTKNNFIDGKKRLADLLKMLKNIKHTYYIGDYPHIYPQKLSFYPINSFSKVSKKRIFIENRYYFDDLEIEITSPRPYIKIEPSVFILPAQTKKDIYISLHPSLVTFGASFKIKCKIKISIKSANLPDNQMGVSISSYFLAKVNPRQKIKNTFNLFITNILRR